MLYPVGSKVMKTPKFLDTAIISFNGLTDGQKQFYYEFVLRVLWKSVHGENFSIFIDEFHRLASLKSSIVSEVLREIRAFGSLMAVSQSFQD